MNIVAALQNEEAKLKRQLAAIQDAIVALNDSRTTAVRGSRGASPNGRTKRTMSAATRARISLATKARWARIRAEKAKKAK